MADPLTERLVLALVEALDGGDPLVTIEVGDNRLNVFWPEVKSSSADTFRSEERK